MTENTSAPLEGIKNFVETFFNKLDIKIDSIEVLQEEERTFSIILKTEESGILIWPHWKNLDTLQHLLTVCISKMIENKVKLHIEVNDYKKNKDERLYSFIKSKIDIVIRSWNDIKLPFFSAYERKKIHSYVADLNNDWIYTKSEWESKERRLFICKKDRKITIDIDGDDI